MPSAPRFVWPSDGLEDKVAELRTLREHRPGYRGSLASPPAGRSSPLLMFPPVNSLIGDLLVFLKWCGNPDLQQRLPAASTAPYDLLPDCSIPPSRRQNRHSPRRLQVRYPTSIENDATTTVSQPSSDLGRAELTPKADSARRLSGGPIRPSGGTAWPSPPKRDQGTPVRYFSH